MKHQSQYYPTPNKYVVSEHQHTENQTLHNLYSFTVLRNTFFFSSFCKSVLEISHYSHAKCIPVSILGFQHKYYYICVLKYFFKHFCSALVTRPVQIHSSTVNTIETFWLIHWIMFENTTDSASIMSAVSSTISIASTLCQYQHSGT